MDPRSLSIALRRIASALESSKRPSKELVSRDIKGIISKLASDGAVHMDSAIYDNTEVSTDELVSAVLESSMTGPVWFSQTDDGWIAIDKGPSTLSPDSPVVGAPFKDKTWGKVTRTPGYFELDSLKWKKLPSIQDALKDADLLWWFTSAGMETDSLISTLEEYGLYDSAKIVSNF